MSSDEEDYYVDSDDMMEDVQDEDDDSDIAMDDDDDDDMDYGDDFKVATGSKPKSYQVDYTSLSQARVEHTMKEDVDHICGILGVDAGVASLLLRHQSWNKERLIEKYMDNPTKVLVDAGATQPEPPSSPAPVRSSSSSSSRRTTRSTSKFLSFKKSSSVPSPPEPLEPSSPLSFTCPICFDDSPDLKQLSLDCGHAACSGCWNAYVISKIRDEGEHCIRCMTEGCALVAKDGFIRNLLVGRSGATDAAGAEPIDPFADACENAVAFNRFNQLLVRNFVSSNPNLKFCPFPGCTNTVECTLGTGKAVLSSVVPTVKCGARGLPSDNSEEGSSKEKASSSSISALGNGGPPGGTSIHDKEHIFCFGCPIEGDHRPVVCGVAKMWMKKCEDDSETANWIKSNTKECSQCQSTIEKNGGCNHMTCKKCKYEFCWVCMGPWSEHGTAWYSCNRYDEKGSVEARDAQSKSRASLERYLHYYNRWANHEQSAKLSLDLYLKTEKKMEDLQLTSSLTWIEVQFMRRAVDVLLSCRTTLKWTYSMGYYLARGNEKDLFEDNQRDLEKAVEDLSELLEGPMPTEVEGGEGGQGGIAELRQKVTDKTVYVQKRNEIVLDDTATGFLDGRWRWNVAVDGFEDPTDDVKID
ncbi:hypothetical protein GYMLUDRAFT_75234 [Collybiopsis luxurians FD-317 M1]|uniref:RBR-type E3 ubiquitin transferase n=1 Tax=Collybiopsis luxurians FD-317 M1 TaxID=944289 RepID=A0A0D0BRV1_9AGAR|nr:hypothetical protein GYMLUDRAFT_75234 [Collybiopsis luxurians FD-317 M1]